MYVRSEPLGFSICIDLLHKIDFLSHSFYPNSTLVIDKFVENNNKDIFIINHGI